jgi:hypothetical protein
MLSGKTASQNTNPMLPTNAVDEGPNGSLPPYLPSLSKGMRFQVPFQWRKTMKPLMRTATTMSSSTRCTCTHSHSHTRPVSVSPQ